MKNQRIMIILTTMVLLFVFTSASYSANRAGQVLAVKNKAFLVRGDAKNIAEPQMELFMKDAVETEKKSRTKLFFNDDSVLNLSELSKVEVEEYMYNAEKNRSKSIYRLVEGSLRVVVGRSDLEVHTATAVAAARGTKFVMWTEKGLKETNRKDKVAQTCVMSLDGKVEFRLKKEAITKDTKKDRVMVNEGTVSCISGVNVEDARPIKPGDDKWMVAGDISRDDDKLPAFVPPEPPVFYVPEGPPVDPPPPAAIEPAVVAEPPTSKQGDFQRLD
ncbi:MAG: FecR domain-containing protein [Nitrospirota bacterium]